MNSRSVNTPGKSASPKTIKRRRQRKAAMMRGRNRISDTSGSDSKRESEVRASLGRSKNLSSSSSPAFSDRCRLEDGSKISCTLNHSGQSTAKFDRLAKYPSQATAQSDHCSVPSTSENQFYASNQMGNAINPTLGDMYVDGRQGPSPPKIAALNQSAASTIPYMSNTDAPPLRRKSPHKSDSPETAHAIKLARKWLGPYTEDPVFAEDLDFILEYKVLTLREDVRFLQRDGQRISLGTGLYSSVYLARNCNNRKLLAVKMLDSATSSRARTKDPELARTVVLDEAMKHYYASSYSAFFPRFVGIVQSSPGDYIGIAMEFVGMDNTSLASLTLLKALARSDQLRLTRKDLAEIFSQVAQGMSDLHNSVLDGFTESTRII